ncbi:MAG: filamentous hemagglutinin N-terminal domain-containing protein, partial [Candidatus Omnitrophica bacterium]|nr:filamentous hemagglutinin N-terminal domain-containing protein [Candidatus Omnitrophota bacterium]
MFVKRFRHVSIFVVLSMALAPVNGYCLPQGEQVVEGSATFDRSQADTLNVNQATDKMIANYNSFSIAQPEAVHFIQPSSSSIALNRVTGVDPSMILGTLTANGRIFLINPNGVTFGQGCRVDTMGLVASTLNLSNADFMAGRYSFAGNGGPVVNLGYLNAPGGYVALLGSCVENRGIIEAELGSVALASGKAVTLKLDPKGLISVAIDEATIVNADGRDDAVLNAGTIRANGGKVLLTA